MERFISQIKARHATATKPNAGVVVCGMQGIQASAHAINPRDPGGPAS